MPPSWASGVTSMPVGEHRLGERLDVVGHDVGAAGGGGPGPRRPQEGEGGAGRDRQQDPRVAAGGVGDVDQVGAQAGCHVHVRGPRPGRRGRRCVGRRAGGRSRASLLAVGVEHRQLGLLVGVADGDAHQEAVELALGQREGALVLDGVLGGHDEERRVEGVGVAVDGDLALGHGLEQGRLGLGRGPVDLVGDEDVGEHRAGPELEALDAAVPHADADDVGGQQVGRELDAAVLGVDRGGEGLGQGGLAHAGHVLDEEVALGDEADHGEGDDVVLALDDLADVVDDRRRRRRRGRRGVAGLIGGRRLVGHGRASVGGGRDCPGRGTRQDGRAMPRAARGRWPSTSAGPSWRPAGRRRRPGARPGTRCPRRATATPRRGSPRWPGSCVDGGRAATRSRAAWGAAGRWRPAARRCRRSTSRRCGDFPLAAPPGRRPRGCRPTSTTTPRRWPWARAGSAPRPGVADFIAMVVSTGVGGGIVLDGRLLDGAAGNAGHIGHVIVEPGRPAAAGAAAHGCLEAEASGTGIRRGHRPARRRKPSPELRRRTGHAGGPGGGVGGQPARPAPGGRGRLGGARLRRRLLRRRPGRARRPVAACRSPPAPASCRPASAPPGPWWAPRRWPGGDAADLIRSGQAAVGTRVAGDRPGLGGQRWRRAPSRWPGGASARRLTVPQARQAATKVPASSVKRERGPRSSRRPQWSQWRRNMPSPSHDRTSSTSDDPDVHHQ